MHVAQDDHIVPQLDNLGIVEDKKIEDKEEEEQVVPDLKFTARLQEGKFYNIMK